MKSAKILRGVSALLAAVFVLALTPMASAAETAERSSRVPEVRVSGESYSGKLKLIDGVTYVRLREFSEGLGASVTWNSQTNTAGVKTNALTLSAREGASSMNANGRNVSCARPVFIEEGRMYVPLRAVGTAFGFETTWNSASFTATMVRHREAIEEYSEDDIYWLSRIISAEAKGEPMSGKLAVGSVVLNRVKSKDFPNTIYGVIFDRNGGVQFTPVANGEIYKTPDADSVEAARRLLDGERISTEILFFINVSIADSFWITENRRYVMTIGGHDFYA